jgi:outer membrane protein insertion porin family
VVDGVLGSVNDLRADQLKMNPDPGFVDRNGDTFNNFSITGNWFRNTLNRGQMPTDGSRQTLGLELTMPGSDLEYARISFNSEIYWPITNDNTWVIALKTRLGYGAGYGNTGEMPFFNNFFAGGLSAAGTVRGFEENSLGPQSTPGARYLTERGLTLLKDENGNIIRDLSGFASGLNNDFGYTTEPLLDDAGVPVLDANGNPDIALAIQSFYLDEDYDSFGGNILTTGSLELLFPIPFVPNSNQVRTALFIDAGNVFSSSCSERQTLLTNCTNFDMGEIRYSAGVSVTYISPMGPLTFYVAAPFGKIGDDTKQFDFTVGTGF